MTFLQRVLPDFMQIRKLQYCHVNLKKSENVLLRQKMCDRLEPIIDGSCGLSLYLRHPRFIPFTELNLNKQNQNQSHILNGVNTNPVWRLLQTRSYWRPKVPRKPYTKPLSFSNSGDLEPSVFSLDPAQPKLGFDELEEFESADENVKKIFSLGFCTNEEVLEKMMNMIVKQVQDHPLDVQSLEIQIAKETVTIRNQIRHCLRFRHDKYSKVTLIRRIERRKLLIAELKSMDIEKFKWLTTELKINYVEPTECDDVKLTKRQARQKVASDAANALVQQKINTLRKRLEEERVRFEKYKDSELSKIENDLKELGVEKVDSLADTLQALGFEEMIPKPKPYISRERLLFLKKVELYIEKKRVLDEEILHANSFVTPKEMPSMPEN